MNGIATIAVLTSGGDAPGMNAAVRAVTRTGIARGWRVLGVRHGFAGLVDGEMEPLTARSVGGIVHLGGTMLGTARSAAFRTEAGQQQALSHLAAQDIDGLIVIGGNGSQTGAAALAQRGMPVVGISSTIDNDISGVDITIGVDTALNIALEAIDRLRVTAASHERVFLVEVMGRDCGYLALMAGMAGGAEAIVIPEQPVSPDDVVEAIRAARDRGKSHAIVVVAEGAAVNADALAEHVKRHRDVLGYELRVTKLGHVQRGGVPTVFDRLLATRLGAAAVAQLAEGSAGVLMGLSQGEIRPLPLAELAGRAKMLDPEMVRLAQVLAY